MARAAAWAGQFYPGEAAALGRSVDALLAQWPSAAAGAAPWAALVPHAGHVYSGACAAAAFARLAGGPVRRVLLLGPNHHRALRGIGLSREAAWETPLGSLPVDLAAVDALLAGGAPFALAEEALAREHALEVQLPFLQRCLPGVSLLPLLVGPLSRAERELARTRLAALRAPADLWLVTSDLSHYHGAAEAERLDAEAARLIAAGDAEGLAGAVESGRAEACGAEPLQLLLAEQAARSADGGGRIELLDRRDSSPVTGDRRQVVGYLSALFWSGGALA
ncbi:AmmeMemoRadiSam system protein B [bacterium]|nr:AmmeMemoRadiSam system protein B [bacterium]